MGIYHCVGFWGRAQSSSVALAFKPIREFKVTDDGVELIFDDRVEQYTWEQVSKSTIVEEQVTVKTTVHKVTLSLVTPNKTYKLGIQPWGPMHYFKYCDKLIKELKPHFKYVKK